jgi:hypothetical protein
MLSLVRPAARDDFDATSRRYLGELRAESHQNPITGEHFSSRELWKVAKHKKKLVAHSRKFTKCAWCERHHATKREINVEHYRPKAEVTCWTGSPPLVSDDPPKETFVSAGYWWLAFDWNNYSLACTSCNQTWKRNLFPVQDPRASYGAGMEARETPLLIDPMSCFRTADHFSWTPLGIMNPESPRGYATIITCGLNRELLVAARERTARNVLAKIEELRRILRSGTTAIRPIHELRELCTPEAEFSGMSRWWLEHKVGWTWEDLDAAAS